MRWRIYARRSGSTPASLPAIRDAIGLVGEDIVKHDSANEAIAAQKDRRVPAAAPTTIGKREGEVDQSAGCRAGHRQRHRSVYPHRTPRTRHRGAVLNERQAAGIQSEFSGLQAPDAVEWL